MHGGVGLPVPRSLFWPVDGSSGLYPCHGPCLCDHASSWLPDPLVSRRLAGRGFHLPRDCAGEGFSSLALPASWDLCQSPQELVGSQADSGLPRDYDSDYSLRVFPTLNRIQTLSLLLQDFLSTLSHPVSVWRQLLGVMSSMSALVPGSGCVFFRSDSMWSVVSSRTISLWSGIPIAIRIFCGEPTSLIFKSVCLLVSLSPTCACSQTHRTPAGVPLSATSFCQARGLPYPIGFPSFTESFWQFCSLFGVSFLLFVVVWWRCSPTTPPP